MEIDYHTDLIEYKEHWYRFFFSFYFFSPPSQIYRWFSLHNRFFFQHYPLLYIFSFRQSDCPCNFFWKKHRKNKNFKIYGISSFEVNLTSLIFMLFHPIFSFAANFILDAYGIRVGLYFGLIFTMLGAAARLFINVDFGWVLLGQSLAAIGNPFVTNAPAKIASNWFFPQNVHFHHFS